MSEASLVTIIAALVGAAATIVAAWINLRSKREAPPTADAGAIKVQIDKGRTALLKIGGLVLFFVGATMGLTGAYEVLNWRWAGVGELLKGLVLAFFGHVLGKAVWPQSN